MTPGLIAKIKRSEAGERIIFIPKKKPITGKIIVSKNGTIYYSYYTKKFDTYRDIK